MSGSASTALKQMTADFEKAHPNIEVKLENQGDYSDLQGKLNSTMPKKSFKLANDHTSLSAMVVHGCN